MFDDVTKPKILKCIRIIPSMSARYLQMHTRGRPGTRACTCCCVTSSILCDVTSPVQSMLYRHNQLYLEGISEFIAIVLIFGVSK